MSEQQSSFYIRTAEELYITDALLKFFVYENVQLGASISGPILIGAFPSREVAQRVIDALLEHDRNLQEQWHERLPGDNHADR